MKESTVPYLIFGFSTFIHPDVSQTAQFNYPKYLALYFGGKKLKVFPTTKSDEDWPEGFPDFKRKFRNSLPHVKKPWDIFKQSATFEDLCAALNPNEPEIDFSDMIAFYSRWHDKKRTEFIDDVSLRTPVMLKYFPEFLKTFLKTISEHPKYLYEDNVLYSFIDVLEAAKTSNAKKAKFIRDCFRDHFMPRKNKIDFGKIDLVESLMIILAKHLKAKCLKGCKDASIIIKGNNTRGGTGTRTPNHAACDKLREGSKKNEPRIAGLSDKELYRLYLKQPEQFIKDFLYEKGLATNKRTIDRHRKLLLKRPN